MSLKMNQQSQSCLSKLEHLKKKVEKEMQIREDANSFNQYRLQFEVAQPSNLVGGTLQQHQIEALEWMINLSSQESNGVLADDMGLGKTIQAISYLAYLREENGIRGKHLIICPKSVSYNWMREIKKWLPSANAVLLPNTENEREECLKNVIKPRNFDVVVATYEAVKRNISLLSRIHWEVLIIDEAHKIKNCESQSFKLFSYLSSTFKLLMTGTPLNNNLKELWSLMYFIMPKIFHDGQLFEEIQLAVEEFEGTVEEKLKFKVKVAKTFHKIIDPYFKRRAKKDLELGLPPKIEKTLFVPLSKMQLQMYRNYLRFGSVYGEGRQIDRNIMVPRKICLHPYLFPQTWPIDVKEEDGHFDEHFIENCGKLKVLDKLLKKLLGQKHKILLFSQFTMLLDVLEDYCDFRGYTFCRLDGSTSLDERQQHMHDFNGTNKYQIFMLSTKAGGLGINLTGADRVIIYDIDWNPQNDIQAMDRAYRIGQTKAVHVYKLITEGTIEERISQAQKYKLVWDEMVIQKGGFMSKKDRDDPFKNFSMQSLANLGKGEIFRLEVDKTQRSIQDMLALGEAKNKKKDEEIRQKMMKNGQDAFKMSMFDDQSDDDTIPQTNENVLLIRRRNYEFEKRERSKFEKREGLPAFKFYVKHQIIKELLFEIYMEEKRDESEQSQNLMNYLLSQLEEAKSAGKFEQWTEEQFSNFVEAHQRFFKEEYRHIAEYIKTKTDKEVQTYSKYFFEKAPNNDRLKKEYLNINLAQSVLKFKLKMVLEGETKVVTEHSMKLANSQVRVSKDDNYDPLEKTKQEILKQIEWKARVIAAQQHKQMKKKGQKEEQQRKRQEIRIKRAEEKKAREQEHVIKRKQIDERKEVQRLARIQRDEDKQKKTEIRQILLKERKEKKEQKEEEFKQAKRKREQEMIERRLKKEQNQNALRIKRESDRIARFPQQEQAIKNFRKSGQDRQTRSRGLREKDSKSTASQSEDPLEIVTAIVE